MPKSKNIVGSANIFCHNIQGKALYILKEANIILCEDNINFYAVSFYYNYNKKAWHNSLFPSDNEEFCNEDFKEIISEIYLISIDYGTIEIITSDYSRRETDSWWIKNLSPLSTRIEQAMIKKNNFKTYCSEPKPNVTKNGISFDFFVFQIDNESYNKYCFFEKSLLKNTNKWVYGSLLESIILCVLESCVEDFNKIYFMNVYKIKNDIILYQAGLRLMQYAAIQDNVFKIPLIKLYDICNKISIQFYESRQSSGEIIIGSQSNIKLNIELEEYLEINKITVKYIRKLLETTKNDLVIYTDASKIYGWCNVKTITNSKDLFKIIFYKNGVWEYQYNNTVLMHVKYSIPQYKKFSKETVEEQLRKIFIGLKNTYIKQLLLLIEKCSTQRHGTMLVVTDSAKEIAKYFEKSAIVIKEKKITSDMISSFSEIDGAVLVSNTAKLYAIGVILDGNTIPENDISNGARHNSAIRYIEKLKSNEKNCMIVTISEDGDITINSTLKL